jgi:hypothetical protein
MIAGATRVRKANEVFVIREEGSDMYEYFRGETREVYFCWFRPDKAPIKEVSEKLREESKSDERLG